MAEAVGEVGGCEGGNGGAEENRDDEDLDVTGGGVRVEDLNKGGAEEVDGIGDCRGADVDGDTGSGVYLEGGVLI